MSIGFYGGTGKVTGANFLVKTLDEDNPVSFLIDCGLEQGAKLCDECNYKPFPYNPSEVDFLFITHPHIDHIGKIPKLVKDGFRGRILSTAPTRDISAVMLEDSLDILAREAMDLGRDPIYESKDVMQAMNLWEEFKYGSRMSVGPLEVEMKETGHTLGSVMYIFHYQGKKIAFSGDLGNSPAPLLKNAEPIKDLDYLVMESVYGDRNHEGREERRNLLRKTIIDARARGGVLMIPAFSLERTQEVLYEIERMTEEGEIPVIPIYLDSPLAIKITDIYKRYDHLLNKKVNSEISSGNDIFDFPNIHMTPKSDQSKRIVKTANPKIVIAGSGMSNGGRILHHEKHFLPDKRSTLLLIGYQAVGTLGRRIEEGAKRVKIFDDYVNVKARIVNIRGYSAHMDSEHLLEYVEGSGESLKKVFVVMGEPKSSLFLVQRIKDYLDIDAYSPKEGEIIEIDFSK